MDWRVLLTTFGVIFLAEMGDKTQLAALTMAWSAAVAAGAQVSLVGMPVAVKPSLPCGECADCAAGRLADCPRKRLMGLWSDGCMAEKVEVPRVNLVPRPEGVRYAGVLELNAASDRLVSRAGFGWPEDAGQNLPGNGVWTFNQGNVSHNNHDNGLFVWQNTDTLHDVSNFVSYFNGSYGIEHGAYNHSSRYANAALFSGGAIPAALAGMFSKRIDPSTLGEVLAEDVVSPGDTGPWPAPP